MAVRTPEDRAIADVEKAIKDADKAHEKWDVAQKKADELANQATRANKHLKWTATHPDLPDEFDLDEFRRSLEEPFEDVKEGEPVEVDGPTIEAAEEPETLAEAETVLPAEEPVDVGQPEDSSDVDEDDNPWGDD